MENKDQLQISVIPSAENSVMDLDQIIFDLDKQIEQVSSQADSWDYFVSIASGLLCATLDILWVGEFDLSRGRDIADEQVNNFVKKTRKQLTFYKFRVKYSRTAY